MQNVTALAVTFEMQVAFIMWQMVATLWSPLTAAAVYSIDRRYAEKKYLHFTIWQLRDHMKVQVHSSVIIKNHHSLSLVLIRTIKHLTHGSCDVVLLGVRSTLAQMNKCHPKLEWKRFEYITPSLMFMPDYSLNTTQTLLFISFYHHLAASQ